MAIEIKDLTSGAGHRLRTPDLDATRMRGQSNASPLVDPRDRVYELRRLAASTRAQADAMHDLARALEHDAWELDRELRRPARSAR